jgi:hypothetical protein
LGHLAGGDSRVARLEMAAGEQMQVSPTFSNNVVTVGGQSWTVPYPVADVRAIGDRIVVIYDYMSGPKNSAFRNVEAFDCVGKRLWTAENPGTSAADAYVEFMSEVPLIILELRVLPLHD